MRRNIGLLLLLVSSVACGRPATEADCQLIIDRNLELQLRAKNVTDPKAVAEEQATYRALPSTQDELKRCVGLRVTDGIMRCVREAQSVTAIEACTR